MILIAMFISFANMVRHPPPPPRPTQPAPLRFETAGQRHVGPTYFHPMDSDVRFRQDWKTKCSAEQWSRQEVTTCMISVEWLLLFHFALLYLHFTSSIVVFRHCTSFTSMVFSNVTKMIVGFPSNCFPLIENSDPIHQDLMTEILPRPSPPLFWGERWSCAIDRTFNSNY